MRQSETHQPAKKHAAMMGEEVQPSENPGAGWANPSVGGINHFGTVSSGPVNFRRNAPVPLVDHRGNHGRHGGAIGRIGFEQAR